MTYRALRWLACAAPLAATFAVSPAFAQNPNCPPGSWFCADAQAGGQAGGNTGAAANGKLEPLPAPQAGGAAQGGAGSNNTTVVVQQGQPAPAAAPVAAPVAKPAVPPTYYYQPNNVLPQKEWGLNLHLQGALMGRRSGVSGGGMGGLGLGLRYKFMPAAALEANVDFYGGRDYNGFARTESALTFNGIAFLNPKSRTQFYIIAGIGWAAASVTDDITVYQDGLSERKYKYGYFGGQMGLGIEFRLGRHVAANVDARGFIRGRVDNGTARPEFVSSDGRATNTSGGVLLNAGLTFYF